MFKKAIRRVLGKTTVQTDSGPQEYQIVEMDIDEYHNKGVRYQKAGQYQKAIKMFKKEIACEPTVYSGDHSLGQVFQALGDIERAGKHYNIALEKAETMHNKEPEFVDPRLIDEIKKDLASLG